MSRAAIIVTGTIGCGAVRRALSDQRGELERRFPSFFTPVSRLDYAFDTEQEEIVKRVLAKQAGFFGVECVLHGGAGGIFKTLWDLGETLQSGLSADLKLIPVRQETIEICEIFGWNPYTFESPGMTVIAAEDGYGLHSALLDAGAGNAVIGTMTDKKARTRRYLEHLRYIDKPRP